MLLRKTAVLLVSLALTLPAIAAERFRDVLDTPARVSAFAAKSLLNGVASAGRRIVAVGQRGHIVYSDDGGASWQQAQVPVSSDLVAVSFPTPMKGWAVGHDGIVLHSADAGETWTRQLDGRAAGSLLAAHYASAGGALTDETARIGAQGAENPFLDVWFSDENNGVIVGAFNLIFRTADGGKTWEPWFDRTDNANRLHLYAIRPAAGTLFIVGEQGLVLRLDTAGRRFVALDTGYRGTFFGVNGDASSVVVHGLRGHAFRSGDGGRSWKQLNTGLQDGITGSTRCGDGRLILVSQAGRMLQSNDAGATFAPVQQKQSAPASAVACIGQAAEAAAVAGARGIRIEALR